jgi:hypothetical protein
MATAIKRVFSHVMTGKDGQTHDLGRWSWLLSFVVIVAGAGWNAWHKLEVDLAQLALALSGNATAHAVAIFAKAKTEPEQGA